MTLNSRLHYLRPTYVIPGFMKNAGHNHYESMKYTELNGYNKHCFTSQNQHAKIASLPKENQDG